MVLGSRSTSCVKGTSTRKLLVRHLMAFANQGKEDSHEV
nr:MAG TPA: hypothetical protein [Caudoviricetes sp.]